MTHSRSSRVIPVRNQTNDMLLDGVQPSRDSFHSLIIGAMKGSRLQDAFYFRDQMKAMGLVPDILEEMKINNVKLNGQTFICLLNTCAASGRVDQVIGIVHDMAAAGLALNKYCYAGLITAYKNKKPITDETSAKVCGITSAENRMNNVSEEELSNIPTSDFVNRRGFLFWPLTVYHAMETILEMIKKDGKDPDAYITMQAAFEDHISSKMPAIELYMTLAEGAMIGHTPQGMQLATETLEKMNARNFFLNSKMGSELLLVASGEQTVGYATANYIWDLMQARKVYVNLPAVEAYLLINYQDREIPPDDPRLILFARTLDNLRSERKRNLPRGE
ncbi:hypothetical protein MKX01_022601 [Papaver californicum]|nr:hypothetical protein MKX01_022601 [Papaver californicum]